MNSPNPYCFSLRAILPVAVIQPSNGEPSSLNLPGIFPHARANFAFDIRGITLNIPNLTNSDW